MTLAKFNSSFYKIAMVTNVLLLNCGLSTVPCQVGRTYWEGELDTLGPARGSQYVQLCVSVCFPPSLRWAAQNCILRIICTACCLKFRSCWRTVSQLNIQTLLLISSVINRAWANRLSIMNEINNFPRILFIECGFMYFYIRFFLTGKAR